MACVASVVKHGGSKPMTERTHVVIVNYNAGAWLSRSLNSALNFTQGPVTVVDNASTDISVAAAKKLLTPLHTTRVQWVENAQNLGFAAANNQVLRELDADYGVLLNPDCELNEQTLPILCAAFEEDPKIGLASCQILNEDGSLQSTSRRRLPTPWSAAVRMLQLHKIFPHHPKFANFDYGDQAIDGVTTETVEAVSGAFMVVRRTAMEEVGLLDEGYFMHCEDLDWCKRFALANWKVGFVGAATVTHAKGVSSQSRPLKVLWTLHLGMNRFFDKYYTQQSPWWLRYSVKLGIGASLIARSVISAVQQVVRRMQNLVSK